jgi:hypothetical protein
MTDDLISRRDAIDELTKFFCDNDVILGDFPNCERNERKATVLMENVRSIDAELQWIPCSKKLPKRTDLYYVTIRDEDGTKYTSCMYYYINLARWEVDVNVIAWMPEPEPYEVDE